MTDIFDEVDEILGEMEPESETMEDENVVEKNFNDSELQDIMAEIENLEKEFESVTDEVVSQESLAVSPNEVTKTQMQKAIDRELEMSLQSDTESIVDDKTPSAIESSAQVLNFDKPSLSTSSSLADESAHKKAGSEISFEASGQMNLNLGFKIGQETAHLRIDPIKGLSLIMNGVELVINEQEGCTVRMENGVKFTIPLTSETSALKKKVA